MRAASHIDFRTAVKMSQQTSACSGLPKLTPLTTCASGITDGCYSYPNNTDQDVTGYTFGMASSGMTSSGCLTPQTPESLVFHEPMSIEDISDTWMLSQPWSDDSQAWSDDSQAWSDDSQASIGLGLEGDMTGLLPAAELWSTSEHMHSAPIPQTPWAPSYYSGSPQSTTSGFVSHSRGTPSLSMSECSVDDFSDSGVFPDDWANYQPPTNQLNMAHMVTSAPFMHDLRSVPVTAPVWEDVFM
jgi:hypothetical protein